MSRIVGYVSAICLVAFSLISISVCQTKDKSQQMSRVMERHSDNVRQWLCKGQGITADQWTSLKEDCINPRINQLIPENGMNTWQKCSEKVTDLCDDSQWMDGKVCAKEMLSEREVGRFHWFSQMLFSYGVYS
ncbi:unnamed protein product [Medioppia subpectinata]|uniref:Uncharacterized protein n=1 Tax=Medioppia subpectinata TaxID=1979941 RepID=A0A7R9Q0I7_9ACAR|nr:unnamed protein product [Medioppia subpectinata]CAG2108131.1 unnamed protein product [Medioppia subpectinata]